MNNRFEYEQQLYNSGASLVIGVDEVGRGPLAGPVVAAAVSFSIENEESWWQEISDSKKLSEKKRVVLDKFIRQNSSFAIGTATVAEIKELNILQASLLAMERATRKLLNSLTGDARAVVLVDGKFIIPNLNCKQEAIIGGDLIIHSIAGASIVAKVYRDGLMKKLDAKFPQYGFAQHKGYGTAGHILAIRNHGLLPIHRASFCGNIL